ncbi:MAG: ABC transporter permease [Bdellovibrionales bacterium]|nr:ABC transporter permease [Bdellovibrionales bacterium]
MNPFLLPSPTAVVIAFIELLKSGELLLDIWESSSRVFAGFALSVLIGTPLGLVLALSPRWRWSVDPLLQFLRPIPPIAWIPLTILWFGLGNGPAYSLTMIASFFPVVLNVYFGVSRIDPQHLDVARAFGATAGQRLREVIWPAALPSILTGYRIGFGTAWMAVMAAEMVASHTGLGYLIQVSQNMLRTDRVLVGMVCIGFVGFLFDRAFLKLQEHWVRWA